jgi:hypothetical protein
VRLLLDEMHAASIAGRLRDGGFDVIAVTEERELRGRADEDLLGFAAGERQVVVTENVRDFAPLARDWAAVGRAHDGIVFTSPVRFSRAARAYPEELLDALRTFLEETPVEGDSWVWWL